MGRDLELYPNLQQPHIWLVTSATMDESWLHPVGVNNCPSSELCLKCCTLASLAKVAYQQPHESITQKTYDADTKTKSKEYVAKSQEVA